MACWLDEGIRPVPDRQLRPLDPGKAHNRLGSPLTPFQPPIALDMTALRPSRHESNNRLRDSLHRLLRVVVTVPFLPMPRHSPSVSPPLAERRGVSAVSLL